MSPFGVLGNRVYAAVIGNSLKQTGVAGIYMSQGANVGLTWTKVSTGIPQRTLDHVERIELTVSAADGTVYAALLGNGSALSMPVAAGATVLNVEDPEFYRSGDQIEIGFVPTTKITVAKKGETKITLANPNLDVRMGDIVELSDGAGKGQVTITSVMGGGVYGISTALGRTLGADAKARFITEKAFIVPGGVDVANKRITIDRLPETAGMQGAQRAWAAGRIVRSASSAERAVGIYRSTNQGSSWTQVNLPQPAGESEDVEVKTTNGAAIAAPWPIPAAGANQSKTTLKAAETGLFPGNQAETHFAMLASPTNGNILFVSGDRQPDFQVVDALHDYFGRHFVGLRQADGTFTWVSMAGNRTKSAVDVDGSPGVDPTAPHADSRDLVAVPGTSTLLASNDGGIAKFTMDANFVSNITPGGGNLGHWNSINGTLGVIQFYDVDYDPVRDSILGGAQDNGTSEQTGSLKNFLEVRGGDGTVVQVQSIPAVGAPIVSTRYFTSQNFKIARQIATAGNQPTAATRLTILDASGKRVTTGFDFVQVYAVNATDSSRILTEWNDGAKFGNGNLIEMQYSFNMARMRDELQFVRRFTRQKLGTSGDNLRTAIYGYLPPDATSLNDARIRPDLLYAGFDSGLLFFREKLNPNKPTDIKQITSYKGSGIRDVAIDPFDFRKLIVIDDDGRVWASSNCARQRELSRDYGRPEAAHERRYPLG